MWSWDGWINRFNLCAIPRRAPCLITNCPKGHLHQLERERVDSQITTVSYLVSCVCNYKATDVHYTRNMILIWNWFFLHIRSTVGSRCSAKLRQKIWQHNRHDDNSPLVGGKWIFHARTVPFCSVRPLDRCCAQLTMASSSNQLRAS